MIKKYLLLFSTVLILGAGCTKPPGEGGTSTIRGKIFVRDYNSTYTLLQAAFYGPDEKVYIIYGDNEVYDDDFDTHFDGTYEFNYLRKGTYTIFAYSDDSTFTEPSGVYPVKQTVEITENGQTLILPDIIILK